MDGGAGIELGKMKTGNDSDDDSVEDEAKDNSRISLICETAVKEQADTVEKQSPSPSPEQQKIRDLSASNPIHNNAKQT